MSSPLRQVVLLYACMLGAFVGAAGCHSYIFQGCTTIIDPDGSGRMIHPVIRETCASSA